MNLSVEMLQPVLAGLGYELVELERARNGLVRVFIDQPEGIKVEDCVRVSNHLTKLFAVEAIAFERLEVSSPGLDRPLRSQADFVRFSGQLAKVKLAEAIDGRKRFIGRISGVDDEGRITFAIDDGKQGAVHFAARIEQMDKARLEPEL